MKNLLLIIYLIFSFEIMPILAQEKMYTKTYDSARKQYTYDGLLCNQKNNEFHKHNFFFTDISQEDYLLNMKIHKPLINTLTKANQQSNINMVIVGGIWWCPDTRDILSKLLMYTDTADFQNITCIGVDRKKQSEFYPLVNQYHIERVPTMIIFKDNQEIGRVVEYGKKGNWEKELANILIKAIK